MYTVPDYKEDIAMLLVSEERAELMFPCTDKHLKYDSIERKYYLQKQFLLDKLSMGAKERLKHMDASDIQNFIENTTDDVYFMILDNAQNNFEFFKFMIATGTCFANFNQISARKEFAKALLKQAEYKLLVYDTRLMSGIDRRTGNVIGERQLRGEFRYMSEDTRKILKGMGLLFTGTIDPALIAFFKASNNKW